MSGKNSESESSSKVLNMGFCIAVAVFGMMFAVSCSSDGSGNSHEGVDLGLSVKWATCNVGADSPEEYGDYFAWGEIRPKSSYEDENSLAYRKSISKLQSAGIINDEGVLTKSHDAASANWGGSWRMPTVAEFEELVSKCEWEWTEQGGNSGYKVTGPSGNSIFLPAACHAHAPLCNKGSYGSYWSSTVGELTDRAHDLYFRQGSQSTSWNHRFDGVSVRPVSE